LADDERPLQGPNGRKPAHQLTGAELTQILDAMRGRKLLNMLRLGIVEPA
jgi:hypothetical protein